MAARVARSRSRCLSRRVPVGSADRRLLDRAAPGRLAKIQRPLLPPSSDLSDWPYGADGSYHLNMSDLGHALTAGEQGRGMAKGALASRTGQDFELFPLAWDDDDDDDGPPAPTRSDDGRGPMQIDSPPPFGDDDDDALGAGLSPQRTHTHTQTPTPAQHPFSPSLLPLPDLVPDSPRSPPAARFLLDPSMRHDSFYRSSSAPVPEGPRRRPGAAATAHEYHPTLYGLAHGSASQAQQRPAGLSQSLGMSNSGWTPQLAALAGDSRAGDADSKSPFLTYHLGDPFALSPSSAPSATPHTAHHLSPPASAARLAAALSDDASLRKTVSPQEAFLDYDDVDHALHSNPRYSAFGAVGVGAGAGQGSLFAPLPDADRRSDERRARSGSPVQLSGSLQRARHANRFSVPRNAVSWESTQPVSEEESGEDDDSPPAPPAVPASPTDRFIRHLQRKPAVQIEPQQEPDDDDDVDEAPTPDAPPVIYGATASSDFSIKSPRISDAPMPAIPPPPVAQAPTSRARPIKPDVDERPPSSPSSSGENDDDSDEYIPDVPSAPSPFVPPAPAGSHFAAPRHPPAPGSSRKRSHTPESASVGSDGDFSDSSSTYSSSRRRSTTKRRRKAAPSSSTSSAAQGGAPLASGSIQCMFLSADGRACGVIFRRPYDLARHRETIHGEGGKGKGKKEWICAECAGSFSRKDALIRHARIRAHDAGV